MTSMKPQNRSTPRDIDGERKEQPARGPLEMKRAEHTCRSKDIGRMSAGFDMEPSALPAFNHGLNQEVFMKLLTLVFSGSALLGGIPRSRRRYRRSEQFYHASPG